jgi:hypothetical protein
MFAWDIGDKTNPDISKMSEQQYNDYYNQKAQTANRLAKLRGISASFGNNALIDGSGGSSGSNSNTRSSSNSSSNKNSLSSFLGGDFGIDSMTDRAKDLAQFRLGLDKDQANFSAGLRENESKNNFGRQTSFEDQQQRGRMDLEGLTQNALTGRLEKELNNRLTQQQKGFDQSNLQTTRAMNLASKRLGQ